MPARIDLTGREYGKWRVRRLDPQKGPGAWWVCECAPDLGGCGAVKTVNGQMLREGRSTQCRRCSGAGKQNRKPAYRPGQRVPGTKWTIKSGPRKSDGHYGCVCDCGVVSIVQVGNLRNGTSTRCGSCRSRELGAAR
jgi:hypothetical protein